MNVWKMAAAVAWLVAMAQTAALAQPSGPAPASVFVDGAIMADRDPTDGFYGSDVGAAARVAAGLQLSPRNSLRFELDVPRWRTVAAASNQPVYCAPGAGCAGGVGYVPARTASDTSAGTISYAFLYGLTLPAAGRLRVTLLAGGGVELRRLRTATSFDELGSDGRIVRSVSSSGQTTRNWPAGVLGVDADVAVTPHLAIVPQLRFHTWPYPQVSIARPGVALRWRF